MGGKCKTLSGDSSRYICAQHLSECVTLYLTPTVVMGVKQSVTIKIKSYTEQLASTDVLGARQLFLA